MIAVPFYVQAAVKYKILHKTHYTEPVLSLSDFVITFRHFVSSFRHFAEYSKPKFGGTRNVIIHVILYELQSLDVVVSATTI